MIKPNFTRGLGKRLGLLLLGIVVFRYAVTSWSSNKSFYGCPVLASPSVPLATFHHETISPTTLRRENTSDKIDYSFFDTILSLPWNSMDNWDSSKQRYTAEEVLRNITPALVAEPAVEINQSCRPPIDYNSLDPKAIQELCQNSEQNVFTGDVIEQSTKVAVLLMLGFEADVIEIRLREMYDFVDKIFIGESANAHHFVTRKPLIWEYLSKQARFHQFLPKITRFIVDESSGLSEIWQKFEKAIWASEDEQSGTVKKKLLAWNQKAQFFGDNDFILFDHADNVLSNKNFFKLRHCKIHDQVEVIGIRQWFPWGRLDTAFKTINNEGTFHSLSTGTIYRFKRFAQDSRKAENVKERSKFVLRGGMHMTDSPYAPFMFVKRYLACTSCSSVFSPQSKGRQREVSALIEKYRKNGDKQEFVTSLQQLLIAQPERHFKSKALIKLKDMHDPVFDSEIYYLPWFLQCNLDRYPGWVGKNDPRIGLQ